MLFVDGVSIQMEDEIVSIVVIIGVFWVGVKVMIVIFGLGFLFMQENIGYVVMIEILIVVVDVQRGGLSMGQLMFVVQGDIMQLIWGIYGDYIFIVFFLFIVQEVFDFMIRVFNLVEKYRILVVFFIDVEVVYMRECVYILNLDDIEFVYCKFLQNEEEVKFFFGDLYGDGILLMLIFGKGYWMYVMGLIYDECGRLKIVDVEVYERFIKRIIGKIENNKYDIISYEKFEFDDVDVVIVFIGIVF